MCQKVTTSVRPQQNQTSKKMQNKILFAIPVLIMCLANVVFGQSIVNPKEIGVSENLTSHGAMVVVVLYIVFDFVQKMRNKGSTTETMARLISKVDAHLTHVNSIDEKIGTIEKRLFTGTEMKHSLITEVALLKDEVQELNGKVKDLDREIKNISKKY